MRVGFLLRSTIYSYVLALIAQSNNAHGHEHHTEALISWLRTEKGYFNSKLEMRRVDANDSESYFGMFTTSKIRAKELLLHIPASTLIKPDEEEELTGVMHCQTVRTLAAELKRGNESQYAPYVNYLLDTQATGQLPSAWTQAGQSLLLDVLGHDKNGKQILPPFEAFDWITDEWYDNCDGSDDDLEEQAALLVIQRSWDDLMIPIYDMMSHRNGKWLNTESSPVHEGSHIKVRASRDIEAGEEIYTTYNFCEDCGGRKTTYGTPEILRDYGFVELYPQRWIFPVEEVAFEIDTVYDDAGIATDDFEVTEWIGTKPSVEGIEALEKQYERLIEVRETKLTSRDISVREHEWNTVVDYHKAMVLALSIAIEEATDDERCLEEGTCNLVNRYKDLDSYPGGFDDDVNYQAESCETMDFYPWDDSSEEVEEFESLYQDITFFQDSERKDMCLQLDTTVQICESYRPHYHEMAVHYTALFLNKIKRVLFVGGGDSMLLHETLKYPSLELVVGLELDQKVTRKCFQYFGTQPHYHNNKVQWWYGDASKSLLMLPKEYFGSFDLVLVDLSETVMSFKVTEGLDIMEALTLLVKPDGIFVKNELYLNKMSEMFKYSAQIHWYDNPVVCSQVMVMGSNKIDFMNPELTDHNVDSLFFDSPVAVKDPFPLFHDYRKNETSTQMCQGEHNDLDLDILIDSNEQGRSPGILMIIEAEQTSADLLQTDLLRANILKTLLKQGLSVVSTILSEPNVKTVTIMVVLQEGYVVARTMPDLNYVAYDMHLWSSFEKHENIERALIAAVGSASSSSFRIIAGGMYGVSTWKDDNKLKGPRFTQVCDSRDRALSNDDLIEQSTMDLILDGMIEMVEENKMTVAVICGEDAQACNSVHVLDKNERVNTVVPLSCPNIQGINEFMEGATEKMLHCEQHITNVLNGAVVDGKRISAIVLDLNADAVMAKIFLRVFKRKANRLQILMPDDVLVMSTKIGSGETEKWRRNFVKRFLKDIYYFDPVSNAEILFYSPNSILEVDVTYYGDDEFVGKLRKVLKTIETQTGIVSEVRDILGGMWLAQKDFKPTASFGKDDYDQSSPLGQWRSQKPWGHQSIFQLESSRTDLSTLEIRRALDAALSKMLISFMINAEAVEVQEFSEIGNGCVLAALWLGGSVIIIWDGNAHIDVNLFLDEESDQIAFDFKQSINQDALSLSIVLDDEHPRGTGRVVNFLEDVIPRADPHWV